jgi:hypothetical protein
MLSQNAARRRKNMTLPLVLHGVFTAVEGRLAKPFEGEVRSVPSILRMLEASFLRLFLKFERFSSLKKSARRGALQTAYIANARAAPRGLRILCSHRAPSAFVPPSFGNRPFTIPGESDPPALVFDPTAGRRTLKPVILSVRLSGL